MFVLYSLNVYHNPILQRNCFHAYHFFQLSPCYGSSQNLKEKLQHLLRVVLTSDCSHCGPQQQRSAGTFQDVAVAEEDLIGDQDLNSF